MSQATLSLADIKAIASEGKTRAYKPEILNFVHSGAVYRDVMEVLPFSEKKIDSVFNSFNNNLKVLKSENPDWPDIQVRKQDAMVLLINMTVLEGELASEAQ